MSEAGEQSRAQRGLSIGQCMSMRVIVAISVTGLGQRIQPHVTLAYPTSVISIPSTGLAENRIDGGTEPTLK